MEPVMREKRTPQYPSPNPIANFGNYKVGEGGSCNRSPLKRTQSHYHK